MEQRSRTDGGRVLAPLVILADLLLIPFPLVAIYDLVGEDGPELAAVDRFWVTSWAVAAVPLVVAFWCAVKVVRDEQDPRTRLRTAWAGGSFAGGVAVLVVAWFMQGAYLPPE